MDSVGDRLKWAIHEYGPPSRGRVGAPGSINAFSRALQDHAPDVPGTSRPMLYRYLPTEDGEPAETVPKEEWLRAAAEVLSRHRERVRWEWLATGEGEPTEEAAKVAAERDGAVTAALSGDADGKAWDALAAERARAVGFKLDVMRGLGVQLPDALPRQEEPDTEGRPYMTPEEGARYMHAWAERHNLGYHVPPWVPVLLEVKRRTGQDGESIGLAIRGPLVSLGIEPANAVLPGYRLPDWLHDHITATAPVLMALAPRIEELHHREGGN